MRRFLLTGGLAAAAIVGLCGPVAAAVTVVASIKPVHSLVAGVMAGAGSPHLIVQGGASPHAISLKPSDATALQEARSEERRVGKACVRPGRSRWSPYYHKKQNTYKHTQ